MTDRKDWAPRHDGDAPPDWDGERSTVRMLCEGRWCGCNPDWLLNTTYRYTPKPSDDPSDAALAWAYDDAALLGADLTFEEKVRYAKQSLALRRLARFAPPEVLRDPLEDVLREAVIEAEPYLLEGIDFSCDAQSVSRENAEAFITRLATELRKNGSAVLAALGVKLEGE